MTDLFDAEDTSTKPQSPRTRRSGLRDAPAASGSSAESLPSAEEPKSSEERAEAIAAEALAISDEVAKVEGQQRILDDAQRQLLSRIVDHRIGMYKRGKIDANEVRRVLLELIANL